MAVHMDINENSVYSCMCIFPCGTFVYAQDWVNADEQGPLTAIGQLYVPPASPWAQDFVLEDFAVYRPTILTLGSSKGGYGFLELR